MKHTSLLILLSIGVITGLVNGLLGIGGGTILIPAMVFLLGISQHQAHGTSLAVILPTTVASCIVYGLNHDLNFTVALEVASGGIIGGYFGAKLMNKIPAVRLRQFFGLFMFLAGLRMMI
ncbi:MAG: sulfite exporter TauE/SafE family protein [Firmicutes bacterium HGW-Firmicutes-8]|nr:MAG: sulfite exporter TauE/SafE family protein [Firmicutes bacterium HGW-Firmicutes-8]